MKNFSLQLELRQSDISTFLSKHRMETSEEATVHDSGKEFLLLVTFLASTTITEILVTSLTITEDPLATVAGTSTE